MNKKALMSIVLLAFVTVGVAFAQSPTLDKLNFASMTSTGSGGNTFIAVSAANKNISGTVVIPDTYNNRSVTRIPGQAFMNCRDITSVTIPASISQISQRAFDGCTNLTSVTFGSSATTMDETGVNASFPGDLAAKYKAGGAGTYTRQAGGTVWTKQAPTVNTSLDGWWRSDTGLTIYIDGNTGYIAHIGTSPSWQDAEKKGYVKTNDIVLRNIRSTGNLRWSVESLGIRYDTRSPNVATGTQWQNSTYTMSADGKTLSANGSVILTRTPAFQ